MSDGRPPFTVLDAELTSLVKQTPAAPVPQRSRLRVAATRAAAEAASPAVERQGGSPQKSLKLLVQPGQEERVGAWIRLQGGRVVSGGARVLVAELPVAAIAALEEVPGVRRAEVPKILLPRLEECRGPATGLGSALDRHGLTGEGVVIGVIDTGVDWSHPDFLDGNGESRIELFLHAGRDGGGDVSRYRTYGRQALNLALQGKRKVPQGDPDGHGTHCASIAAGNGQASQGRFRGVAPGATLMAVRSEPLLDDHTIRAIRDIFRRAGRRPAVISLSLGHHYGAHDGTASLENVIAEQSGPGRIVVVAAGNEGSDGIHWHGELVEGKDLLISFRIADAFWQYADVWVPRGDEVEIFIESPDGAQTPPHGEPVETIFGTCTATWRRDRVNLDSNLHVAIEQGRVNHVWNVRLRPHGMLKPDIAAPGQYITAALAGNCRMSREPQFKLRHHPSVPYITLQGTSMATPFVAGVVALMLQREPRLTPEEIQQRLRITARRDRDTRRVWGSGFGFGKIDVEALLDYEA
jgi:subtilisin family serine protease